MKKIIMFSFLLSLIHSILFFEKSVGISVVIFCIFTLFFLFNLLKANNKIKNKSGMILLLPIILLSTTYLISNNILFQFLNMIAIIGLTFVMIVWITYDIEKIKAVYSRFINLVLGPLSCLGDIFKYIKEITKRNTCNIDNRLCIFKKLGKAILISTPIVLLIIYLLASADTVFESVFNNIIDVIQQMLLSENILNIFIRILFIGIMFLYFSSFALNMIEESQVEFDRNTDDNNKNDRFTINTILTILNGIYFFFCIIQYMYLFTKIGVEENFNYAEYARKGFFQLMIVSLINFGIIFISTKRHNTNMKNSEEKNEVINTDKYTKVMNLGISIFTIIIIISSFFRMYLYEREFGYTYLRLFVYYILITEIILMIPTIGYIMKSKLPVIKSYILIIATTYVLLNYINIDNLIAKNNINRYFEEMNSRKIDFVYLQSSIGTDGVNQMMRLLDSEDEVLVNNVKIYLNNMKKDLENDTNTWQEFNISKNISKKILAELDFRDVESYESSAVNFNKYNDWESIEIVNNSNINQGDSIYGFDFRLEHNDVTDEFVFFQGMGECDKIKSYTTYSDKVVVSVYSNGDIRYDYYSININRDEITKEPEYWTQGFATIYNNGKEVLIEMPFNRSYNKGTIENIEISFGKVD